MTTLLRKVLLRSRSRLVYFAMSTSMPPEGSEIFHRKESFLVSLFASEGKTDEGKEFDPIHDRRVNGKSLFLLLHFSLEDLRKYVTDRT